jgi:hypothetical protein
MDRFIRMGRVSLRAEKESRLKLMTASKRISWSNLFVFFGFSLLYIIATRSWSNTTPNIVLRNPGTTPSNLKMSSVAKHEPVSDLHFHQVPRPRKGHPSTRRHKRNRKSSKRRNACSLPTSQQCTSDIPTHASSEIKTRFILDSDLVYSRYRRPGPSRHRADNE